MRRVFAEASAALCDPVDAHLRFDGMGRTLLTRWIKLFGETYSELFDEHLAAAFRMEAVSFAEKLQSRQRSAP
jgi:truncated hemoglobin YjbI